MKKHDELVCDGCRREVYDCRCNPAWVDADLSWRVPTEPERVLVPYRCAKCGRDFWMHYAGGRPPDVVAHDDAVRDSDPGASCTGSAYRVPLSYLK